VSRRGGGVCREEEVVYVEKRRWCMSRRGGGVYREEEVVYVEKKSVVRWVGDYCCECDYVSRVKRDPDSYCKCNDACSQDNSRLLLL